MLLLLIFATTILHAAEKPKGGDQTQPLQLCDLADDLGETKNLAAALPAKLTEMQAPLEKLITEGRSTPGPMQSNDLEVIRHSAKIAGEKISPSSLTVPQPASVSGVKIS